MLTSSDSHSASSGMSIAELAQQLEQSSQQPPAEPQPKFEPQPNSEPTTKTPAAAEWVAPFQAHAPNRYPAIPPFSSTFSPEAPPQSQLQGAGIRERLLSYCYPQTTIQWDTGDIAIAPLPVYSPAMLANAYFFGHPRWGKKYLNQEHRGVAFRDRWHHALMLDNPFALGSAQQDALDSAAPAAQTAVGWDGKVVVDLGCGPGNLLAALGGAPADIIGVDISQGALRRARQLGYLPLLSDVHHLPLRSQIADVVVANALLHHCDHVTRVLTEAARLVKPGGLLITDLDPQRSAWERWGWGLWVDRLGWPRVGWRESPEEMAWRIATEIHNRQPGVGIETEVYGRVLEPLGFRVNLYPHNPGVGAEVFQGERGRSPLKIRWGQRLSGLDPEGPEAAQSILCIAQRSVHHTA